MERLFHITQNTMWLQDIAQPFKSGKVFSDLITFRDHNRQEVSTSCSLKCTTV